MPERGFDDSPEPSRRSPSRRFGPASGAPVILGVTASDVHVVANQLIALQLRALGYEVVNLGACTPVGEFVDCVARHPAALAVVIGSHNGHAVEDLTPLRDAKQAGRVPCPVIVGGNLSIGSVKTGNEAALLHALGVDHVLQEVDQLIALLARLRAARATGSRSVQSTRNSLHPSMRPTSAAEEPLLRPSRRPHVQYAASSCPRKPLPVAPGR